MEHTYPKHTDPKHTDPKHTDPKHTDPKHTDPKRTYPGDYYKDNYSSDDGYRETDFPDERYRAPDSSDERYRAPDSSDERYRAPDSSDERYRAPDSSDERYRELTSPKNRQGEKGSDSTFLTKGSRQGNYLAYPRFLIGMDLNETAKLIYILLLDRGRLSAKQGQFVDENGYAYIYYDIQSLADHSGKSATTVKEALRDLEEADLILRTKQKVGKHRRIYVKTRTENRLLSGSAFRPREGRKTVSHVDGISSPYNNINKININKTNISRNYSYGEGESL